MLCTISALVVAGAAAFITGPYSASASPREDSTGGQGDIGTSTCVETVGELPFALGIATQACDGVAPAVPVTPPRPDRAGPTNTGPRTTVPLAQMHGDLTVRVAGTVIDSVQVNGTVRIEAENVTIRNSRIAGRAGLKTGQPLVYAGVPAAAGLQIIDTEVAPSDKSWIVNGVFGAGFKVLRSDVHHVIDAIHIFGDDVTVRASWLHDPYHGPDTGQTDGVTHDDSVQVQKGNNVALIGNTMTGAYNAALQITQDQGPVSNLSFKENVVSGGGCTLNIAEKSGGVIRGLTVADNSFGASRFNCPIILSPTVKSISVLTNNVWATGGPIHFTCRDTSKPNWRC